MSSTTINANIIRADAVDSDLTPDIDNFYNLGSSSYRWANVYAASIPSGGAITGTNITLTDVKNQIHLGTGTTTTITAPTPTSSQTITIPDSKQTTASVVLTELAQTVNGVKTFSSAPNLTSLTTGLPLHVTGVGKAITSGAISLTADVSGILPIANGGTNSATALANGTLMVSSGGAIIEGTSNTSPVFGGSVDAAKYTIATVDTLQRQNTNLVVGGGMIALTDVTNTGNLVIGDGAGAPVNHAVTNSILIGGGSGASLLAADNNILIGLTAGAAITSGGSNVFLGTNTGSSTTTGSGNIFIGDAAGTSFAAGDSSKVGIGLSGIHLISGDVSNHNIAFCETGANGTFGGGQGMIYQKNASTAPTSDPTTGVLEYSDTGVKKWRYPSGAILTLTDSATTASTVMTEGIQTINGDKTLSGTTNLSALTINLPLQLDGSKNIISSAVSLSGTGVTGTLPIAHGGTNSATALGNGTLMVSSGGAIVEGTSSSAPTFTGMTLSGVTASRPLTVNGSGVVGGNQIDLSAGTTDVKNTLAIGNGGTNSATALSNGFLMKSLAGAIVEGPSVTAPSFSTTNLSAANNQLSLGTGGPQVTVSAQFAVGKTLTIPDTGANASFVMTELAQTINGDKKFSGTTNLSNGTLTATRPLKIDGSKNIISAQIDLAAGTTDVKNTLAIGNGGTNSSTSLGNGTLMVSSGGAIVEGTSSSAPIFSGFVTQKQSFISSHNSTNQSITGQTDMAVVFDTDDVKTNWATSRADNTKFFGPQSGYYGINYQVTFDMNAVGVRFAYILSNGNVNIRQGSFCLSATTDFTGMSGTGVYFMNGTTDYVQLWVWQNSGNNMTSLDISDIGAAPWARSQIYVTFLHS